MAGKGSLIKLPGCRYWYADYYRNGKKIRKSTREESKQDAARKLREFMAEADAGLNTDRWLTYADLRRVLIQNYKEKGNKSLHVRANGDDTVNGLAQLDRFFGYSELNPGPYVEDITTETARSFVSKRKAEGAGNSVINRSLACLRHMLRLGVQEGKITRMPFIPMLKEPPARTGTISREKFDELLYALPAHLRPFICFLYWTGVRGAEALAIEWEQVDLENAIIVLREGETKNDEARTIPLASDVLVYLHQMEPKTGRVFSATNLRKEWCKACAAVGLGTFKDNPDPKKKYDKIYRGLNIHDLRRTALTELTRAGVHMFVAMRISGHKDATVFRRYNIVNTGDLQAAIRLRENLKLAETTGKKSGKKALPSRINTGLES